MLEILSSVGSYAVAILTFLVLILIHELGHLIAAKSVGVRVNEFSVGFGPKIFSKKWGETTYMLKAVPFGGYCAMEGEDEESADERAFCNKKAWQRAIVIVAGAVFNILLGFVIVAGTLLPQKAYTTTTVAEFMEGAVSAEHGLREGDKILSVDGRRVFTTRDLGYTFTGVEDGVVDLTVLRNGEKVELDDVKFKSEMAEGIEYVQVDFFVKGEKRTLGSFLSQSVKTTVSYGRIVWFSLIDLITGKFGISAVSGPVGVTTVISQTVKQSLADLWPIMALITVNLGIFNLLPLPALDGGRLLFIIIEMLFRKPVPAKYEGIVHTVGLLILLAFMLLVTAKDIWSLVVK